MKTFYTIAIWGDTLFFMNVVSQIKRKFPIAFKMVRIEFLEDFKRNDYDIIYLGINKYNFFYFTRKLKEISLCLYNSFKFIVVSCSLDEKERKILISKLEEVFGHWKIHIMFNNVDNMLFEFMNFILYMPKKKIVFSDGKIVEFDFNRKVVRLFDTDGTLKRGISLSAGESDLFRCMLCFWEDNKKYVTKELLSNFVSEESILVILHRLKKKFFDLFKEEEESIYIKNEKKRGYFITGEKDGVVSF